MSHSASTWKFTFRLNSAKTEFTKLTIYTTHMTWLEVQLKKRELLGDFREIFGMGNVKLTSLEPTMRGFTNKDY